MRRALDIAIVGYGIAGIAAAVHLRRAGHRITHFERSDPPRAGGAGMLLHPAAQRQLASLGVLAAAVERGAPVRRLGAKTHRGRTLIDFDYGELTGGQCGLGIQRATLHRLLAHADAGRTDVLAGRRITGVDPERGLLREADGVRHGPFDLVVVADGAESDLRGQLFAGGAPDRGGAARALVGLLDDPDRFAGDQLVQYFDDTRHLSVWPAGPASVGDTPRCAIALNMPASSVDERTWRTWVSGLCPPIQPLLVDGARNANLRIVTYRDVELPRRCVGRVAIIGDAAHSMSPQLGTGAQLALEDASALAEALSDDEVPAALDCYERIRGPQLRRHHAASRFLTPLFQSNSRALAFLRDNLLARAVGMASARHLAQSLFS